MVDGKFKPDKYGLLCDDHRTFQCLAKPLTHPVYNHGKKDLLVKTEADCATASNTQVGVKQEESPTHKEEVQGWIGAKAGRTMEQKVVDEIRSIYLSWLKFGIKIGTAF